MAFTVNPDFKEENTKIFCTVRRRYLTNEEAKLFLNGCLQSLKRSKDVIMSEVDGINPAWHITETIQEVEEAL